MSGSANVDRAWRVPPGKYLAKRPAPFRLGQPNSQYVTMRDSCRLAVDAYVPQSRTTLRPRRLSRRSFFSRPITAASSCGPAGRARSIPIPENFATSSCRAAMPSLWLTCAAPGASFGTRDSFRSPRERDDTSEIADWIVAQPWSNGRIGATGISYVGAAADFLASTGHPAVKAIAPLSSVWDTYARQLFSGRHPAEVADQGL